MDEAIEGQYIQKRPCARARDILVLNWLIVGYILTMSYKSVLLSNLIHIEYENTIDSIEDALQSQKQIVTSNQFVFSMDQRTRVKKLAKRIVTYKPKHGMPPLWVVEG